MFYFCETLPEVNKKRLKPWKLEISFIAWCAFFCDVQKHISGIQYLAFIEHLLLDDTNWTYLYFSCWMALIISVISRDS